LGRVGIFEIMKMTFELEQIILSEPSQEKIISRSKEARNDYFTAGRHN